MPTTDTDMGAKAVHALMDGLSEAVLDTGLFADQDKGHGGQVAMIGAVNEYGSADGRTPSRSFLRSAHDESHAKAQRIFDKQIEAAIKTGRTENVIEFVLTPVGAQITAAVKRKIIDIKTPPNKPATIRRKRSSNPLIDTNMMRKSVMFKIRKLSEIVAG